MASQWAAPPPGYPAGHGQAYGNQQLATPPQAATAVAVSATSNGVGNPYVVVTPASATPSTGQSTRLNLLLLIFCTPFKLREIRRPAYVFVRLDWMRCSRQEGAVPLRQAARGRDPQGRRRHRQHLAPPCVPHALILSLSFSDRLVNRHHTLIRDVASDV